MPASIERRKMRLPESRPLGGRPSETARPRHVPSGTTRGGSMQTRSAFMGVLASFFWVPWSLGAAAEAQTSGGSKAHGGLQKMDFGKTPDGTPVELYVLTNGRMTVKVMTYGAIVTELHVPDRRREAGRRRPGLRRPRGLPGQQPLLRGHDRAGRQPDRQGEVHTRRQGVHAGRQQRPQLLARRAEGVRQGGLEGRGGLRARRPGRQAHLPQPGRRGRLSRGTSPRA